jgi:hypothetical protein
VTRSYVKGRIFVGERFGELVVVREVGRVKNNRRFECQCDCGTVTVKYLANLIQGKSRSCGCNWADRTVKGRAAILAARRERSQEDEFGRICLTCGERKTWDKFSYDSKKENGKSSNCLECSSWRSVKAMWGITKVEWHWLSERQGNVCAICYEVDNRRLSVDHDHNCCGGTRGCKKCIRGLLCSLCNRMIGLAEGREAARARFVDYLERRPFLGT